jgi:hypothetical protein
MQTMSEDHELPAKRATAVYADAVNRMRIGSDLSEAEMDRQALAAVEASVWGHDAKKVNGKFVQQGIGSPGHETSNHFAALLRYQGKEAWEAAVREIYKRDPDRARKLGLPQPART